ncbi:MAG: amidohydrolase family protein, partial [Gammaproteobacteria bacterium]|nr:amidohydrolase family protein [Gammaproteobacteria bacterium]
LPVTMDVAAHQLHLTDMDIGFFDSHCHVLPPLRTQRDRDVLRKAVAQGCISAICSDHQPHDTDAKLAPFGETEPGISAVETLLPLALRLIDDELMTMSQLISRLTIEPARILGLNVGHFTAGAQANICIFDPEQLWTVTADTILSQGKNTPFIGWEMKGRVTHTLLNGKIVYQSNTGSRS